MLIPEQGELLLDIAFGAIEAHLGACVYEPPPIPDGPLRSLRGVFVTLRREGRLRGCVGYAQPVRPLFEAVREMAVSSAVRDSRFEPLLTAELRALEVELSVLTPLERIDSPDGIRIGEHGLFLRAAGRSGLLLPQVAAEQGWGKLEFLDHLCAKAGLPHGSWRSGADLFAFGAQRFSREFS